MRLARFEHQGRTSFGAVRDDGIVDLGFSDEEPTAWLLEPGGSLPTGAPKLPLSDVKLQPPLLTSGSRIFALGWAYRSHQAETNHDTDPFPFFFLKDRQSLVGHGAHIVRPTVSTHFDYEGEFALIVGQPGRHIPEQQALDHIAGYSILMDGSVRDWQKHSVTAGKNFDASSAFGPWIVTRDDLADPNDIQLTTRLNGEVVQETSTRLLAWRISYLIHYCSSFTMLRTGDVISTGTPGGVGSRRSPPLWLEPNDVLEVEVGGVGVLRNTVVQE